MFTDQYREGDVVRVAGSGIVVTKDGFILTNAHVVEKSKKVTVTLSNGRVYKAKLISMDTLQDLAVLKADVGAEQLKPAPFGDSSKLQSGEWVIAVGCPVGLDFTATLGIVSNPKRSAIEVGAPHMKCMFIQTDAALNQGNSGGPLVNQFGEVIGINTMVRTNTEAIGFAIPINSAMSTYEVLKDGKKPTHAYFGLEVMTVSPDWAKIYNDDPNANRLPEVNGALVVRVAPGSPAALSGLRKYDIIVEVDGNKIRNSEDADSNMDKCKPGSLVDIKVARGENGGFVTLKATPQDLLIVLEEKRNQLQQHHSQDQKS
jgi:S1-C subfamily serine protease